MDSAKSSMKTQFLIMMIGASFATLFIVATVFTMDIVNNNKAEIAEFRAMLIQDVEQELRNETLSAINVIDEFHKRQLTGELTEAEAKLHAAETVRNMRYEGDGGYFWIDTLEGVNVVLLGRADVEGKSRIDATDPSGRKYIQEMIENAKKQGGGFTDLQFPKPNQTEALPKKNFTMTYEPYGWVVGTGVWIDYIDGRVADMQARSEENLKGIVIKMSFVGIILEVVMVFIAIFFANYLIIPIRALTSTLDVLATGDFRNKGDNNNIDPNRSDEIGVMARAVTKLQDNVSTMISKVMTSAEHVAAASQQLTASADQSTTAINQVAESIVNVAGACTEQFTEVENATAKAEELKQHMDTFKKTLQGSSKEIEHTNAAADSGNKAVKHAISQMERIETSVSASADVIAQLGEESEKIGKIVDAISEIADQTNLLALNAAIEAARAGEHGRGFAVVADEVRKLAEQSQTSAKEISALIGSIQSKSQDAVTAMQEGVQNVKTGADAVDEAGKTFETISERVTEVSKSSERMAKIVQELVASTDVITQSVEKINVKSREVASESETVSASGEQQSATMHEIADASRSLAEMAQQMQDIIGKFKI